jgi:acyl carrier protein
MNTVMTQPVEMAKSIEVRLKEKWTELLDVTAEEIVSNGNFFSLGGNSMLLLSLHVFMSQEFSISLNLSELLEHAEFAAMVVLVQTRVAIGASRRTTVGTCKAGTLA